mmetsp:Transcript_22942/g.38393  ORF Transcript_22942/g.38393 Transcript_22942/m.38393 type:complete len:218 (+) Transcript_22942:157-810(+)
MATPSEAGFISHVLVPEFTKLNGVFSQGGLEAVSTEQFTTTVATLIDVFDRLGMTFAIASKDVKEKRDHLLQPKVLEESPFVAQLVSNDIEKDVVCQAGQGSRMLHGLKRLLHFVYALMGNLNTSPNTKLYDAAKAAYEQTLAMYHARVVRYAIKGGLMTLPYRETFYKTLHETEETAQVAIDQFMAQSKDILAALDVLFVPYDHICRKDGSKAPLQ